MTVLSVRTDPDTDAALEALGDRYGNITDTIRVALQRLADDQRRQKLREESLAAANDPEDRAEMMAVLAEMEALGEG